MSFLAGIKAVYEKRYKLLVLIPLILLLLGLVQIVSQQITTGSFLLKDISLKGGTTLTIYYNETIDINKLKSELEQSFPSEDFNLRVLEERGSQVGFIVDTSLGGEKLEALTEHIEELTGKLSEDQISVEIIGSMLSESFFKETLLALLIAFVLMGIVVFAYFRVFIPSVAVILSAFSDIVLTLSVSNLLGLKISTAGLAALLMLIGYSVDTDILLSTHVLRRRDAPLMARIYRAMKTGLTTTSTTLVAVTVALLLSKSDVITEIMRIVFIGLLIDLLNTWMLNAGLLRMFMEKKKNG